MQTERTAKASTAPDPAAGRVFVDAFDRLADRVLERIRTLRQDVDGDLTAIRSELANLRQAVEAVGDRVQLRHVRSTLDEVHGDVIGLRRAVLEWPELDQLAADVTALREEVAALRGGAAGSAPPTAVLDDAQVDRIAAAVAERLADRRGKRRER